MSGDHGVPGLRRPDHERLALRRMQPRVPSSGTQPSLRPTRVAQAEQERHRGARGAIRLVVSGLRCASTSLARPDQRPHRPAGARWCGAGRDASALPRLQHPQALGADADAASTTMSLERARLNVRSQRRARASSLARRTPLRCVGPWGWTKSVMLCVHQAAQARMSGRVLLFLHKAGHGR